MMTSSFMSKKLGEERKSLNHRESTPLYVQLKQDLSQQMDLGRLKPGQPIPSERSLCAKYRISRTTVRQALSEMINEGVLYRKQGKGTFVIQRKVNQGLVHIVNFARTVLELGLRPSTRILGNQIMPADIQTAKTLDVSLTSQILKLTLLGKGDAIPLVLYESYFPLPLGQRMAKEASRLEKKDLPFSTYDLYDKIGGVTPRSVVQTFEAITADNRLAAIMKVRRGTPIFMITSIFQTADHRPLEFRTALYRGDRYKFHLTRELS
jgi:GntR family transcriptional regulator